jgi:hypothetical protein
MKLGNDELDELWASGGRPIEAERALRAVRGRAERFGRTIRMRDWRETIAAGLVAVFFMWIAFHERDVWARAADVWIALSGVWIAVYLHRRSRAPETAARTATIEEHGKALLQSYGRQIALLKTVKYWYLGPMWVGFIGLAVARWRIDHNTAAWVTAGVVYTGLFGFLAWLNESWAARKIEAQRAELVEMMGRVETAG